MISNIVELICKVIKIKIINFTKGTKLIIKLPNKGMSKLIEVNLSYITESPESKLVLYESIYQQILELLQSYFDDYAEIYTDTFKDDGRYRAEGINHCMLLGTGLILLCNYDPSTFTYRYALRFNDGQYTQHILKYIADSSDGSVFVKKNIKAMTTAILDMLQYRFEKVAKYYADSKF